MCSEHFSVDGTLIESLASAKSFQPKEAADDESDESQDANGFKPRNAEVDFHGQQRTNETHQSQTDPEAKLYREGLGKEAKLSHMGHVICENRNGLIITITATQASGTAERDAAIEMLADVEATHGQSPATLGGDKGFDDGGFFQVLEMAGVEPYIPLVKDPGCQIRSRFSPRLSQPASQWFQTVSPAIPVSIPAWLTLLRTLQFYLMFHRHTMVLTAHSPPVGPTRRP